MTSDTLKPSISPLRLTTDDHPLSALLVPSDVVISKCNLNLAYSSVSSVIPAI